MADLICMAFPGRDTAARVLEDLRALQKEYLVDLEDACVVTRNEEGEIELHQAVNLVKTGAIGGATWGALWGALIGILFANPLAGLVAGAAAGAGAGALGGALSDYGINDDFMKQMGASIGPQSSALFILVRKMTLDKVLPELSRYEGTVLKTSLSGDQEKKLREALAHHLAQAS